MGEPIFDIEPMPEPIPPDPDELLPTLSPGLESHCIPFMFKAHSETNREGVTGAVGENASAEKLDISSRTAADAILMVNRGYRIDVMFKREYGLY